MKRSSILRAGLGLVAGLVVLTASDAPAVAQSGPTSAIAKARAVSDVASARAADMDTRVGAAAAETARADARADRVAEAPASVPRVATASKNENTRSRATKRYDPGTHRDPFQPPTIAAENGDIPRTPLERYEIGQLRLVGVVWGGPTNRAMVEDSAGLGYIVTQGTPIGSSGGFVRDIEPARVLIEETITNFYGEAEPREIVMELPQEDEAP